jgi:hypothetical protein
MAICRYSLHLLILRRRRKTSRPVSIEWGFPNVERQVGVLSATCTGMWQKVVNPPTETWTTTTTPCRSEGQRTGNGSAKFSYCRPRGAALATQGKCKLPGAKQPADCTARVKVCRWLLGNQRLHTKMSFPQDTTSDRDGITNTRNSHVWSLHNAHASTDTFSDQCSS